MDHEGLSQAPPLRIMQWNTLADGLAQFGDFHWCEYGSLDPVDAEVLDWEKRGPKVLKEILSAAADVVCLQEVNHFSDFLLPHLLEHGYDGTFEAKKYSPALKFGFPSDGCAVFYRTSRLQLKERNFLLYPGLSTTTRNQGVIVCRFQDLRAQGREFIVATTHLKAKAGKENEERRLSQAQYLMEKMAELTQINNDSLPCVLCGDFNASPTSKVYDFLQRHELSVKSVYSCGNGSGTGSRTKDLLTRDDNTNPHDCDDAEPYMAVDWTSSSGGADFEPSWTTWKYRSSGLKLETIDYIWVSKDKALCPVKILPIPSQESLGCKGLPSESMPSDHMPLVCELRWT